MFYQLSKHLEFRQKYSAARRVFNSLLGVWISWWNTVSRVWYTAVSRKVVQQNRTRKCRKALWVMGVYGIWLRCFSDIEGIITNKSIYAFSFLVGKNREPQSINAKLFLPLIPIGIVAYALTLLWYNLCRNSCITSEITGFLDSHLCKLNAWQNASERFLAVRIDTSWCVFVWQVMIKKRLQIYDLQLRIWLFIQE